MREKTSGPSPSPKQRAPPAQRVQRVASDPTEAIFSDVFKRNIYMSPGGIVRLLGYVHIFLDIIIYIYKYIHIYSYIQVYSYRHIFLIYVLVYICYSIILYMYKYASVFRTLQAWLVIFNAFMVPVEISIGFWALGSVDQCSARLATLAKAFGKKYTKECDLCNIISLFLKYSDIYLQKITKTP